MIWYKFHIGDYISHTMHLDDAEDLAYRRLLDWYYMSEKPLPLDVALVSRRIRLDEDVVAPVLNEFFEKTKEGYINSRADKEIASYNARVELNRKSAKLGGRPKTIEVSKEEPLSPPKQNRNRTDTEQNITKDANASMSGTSFPPCPHKELLKLYQKHLPHLTQPRLWEGSRMTTMKSRWVQASKPSEYSPKGYSTLEDGLAWWDSFFGYIAKDTSLAKGFETNGRVWQPDLVWIVNPTNFAKIIDGKYSK
jgi:uncharacterized protein YdaU (DUF1376 family)